MVKIVKQKGPDGTTLTYVQREEHESGDSSMKEWAILMCQRLVAGVPIEKLIEDEIRRYEAFRRANPVFQLPPAGDENRRYLREQLIYVNQHRSLFGGGASM